MINPNPCQHCENENVSIIPEAKPIESGWIIKCVRCKTFVRAETQEIAVKFWNEIYSRNSKHIREEW